MPHPGRELGERDQHEAARFHPRVGNDEFRSANDAGAIENDVEVDHPRPARDQSTTAQIPLDRLQCMEQLPRQQIGFRLHDAIQEPGLGAEINRLGGIQGGTPQDANPRAGKRGDRAIEVRGAVAEV